MTEVGPSPRRMTVILLWSTSLQQLTTLVWRNSPTSELSLTKEPDRNFQEKLLFKSVSNQVLTNSEKHRYLEPITNLYYIQDHHNYRNLLTSQVNEEITQIYVIHYLLIGLEWCQQMGDRVGGEGTSVGQQRERKYKN